MFTKGPKDDECSIPDHLLKELTAKIPTWANHNAENLKKVAMAALFMLEKKGKWKRMTNQWRSLFFLQGWVAVNTASKKGWVVVYVCEWAFLGYQVVLELRGGFNAIKFGESVTLKKSSILEPVFVKDEKDWIVGWPKLRTPCAPNPVDKKQPEGTWNGDSSRVQLP